MKEIAISVINALGKSLAKVLMGLIGLSKDILKLIFMIKQEKKEQKEKQEIKEYNDKVKDACDNGSVEDLINL